MSSRVGGRKREGRKESSSPIPSNDVEIDVGIREEQGCVDVVQESVLDIIGVDEAVSYRTQSNGGQLQGSSFVEHSLALVSRRRKVTHVSHTPSNPLLGSSLTLAAMIPSLSSSPSSSADAENSSRDVIREGW